MDHFFPLTKGRVVVGAALLCTLILAGSLALVRVLAFADTDKKGTNPLTPDVRNLELGRVVYEQNCAICHGAWGNGQGMAGHMLGSQPRNLQEGIFKFRSTPSGSLPTDQDLLQTVSQGLRGTGMIGQNFLPEAERRAVVSYLKTFSKRFESEKPQTPIPIPEPPPRTPELIAKGRDLYQKAGCFTCHGTEGRGNGPSPSGLRDHWGFPIEPADLTRPLKRGSSAEAIYKTLVTGLDGTPMPSYEGAMTDEEFWALSFYVASLNTGILSEWQRREERAGQMVLHMHGGHGPGMMRRMPMMR